MQLTKFTDYCLRVLMYLGARGDGLATINEISEAYRVSNNHLMKVVQHLAGTGYVESVRGKGGGIRLARNPKFINLGDVVRNCEQNVSIVECFDLNNTECPLLPACTLRSALNEATNNFFATLDRYSVADLVIKRDLLRASKLKGAGGRKPVRKRG
jgi:Rrf2 family transcriptional regulator, nitric oxide-sensitive transcriptional repressor